MEPVGKKTGKKVIIVGGVAGGASCAAVRSRRISSRLSCDNPATSK